MCFTSKCESDVDAEDWFDFFARAAIWVRHELSDAHKTSARLETDVRDLVHAHRRRGVRDSSVKKVRQNRNTTRVRGVQRARCP